MSIETFVFLAVVISTDFAFIAFCVLACLWLFHLPKKRASWPLNEDEREL